MRTSRLSLMITRPALPMLYYPYSSRLLGHAEYAAFASLLYHLQYVHCSAGHLESVFLSWSQFFFVLEKTQKQKNSQFLLLGLKTNVIFTGHVPLNNVTQTDSRAVDSVYVCSM